MQITVRRMAEFCTLGLLGASGALAQAPTGLTYPKSASVTYHIGHAFIPDTPQVTGGAPASYSVTPTLPSGLTLNATSGILSGKPNAPVSSATEYIVTASNLSGFAKDTLSIAIAYKAPPPFSYGNASPTYYATAPISVNSPEVTGPVSGYAVTPPLPSGLVLNATTGLIRGIPAARTSAANYTVTATNPGGSTQTVLAITVDTTLWKALRQDTSLNQSGASCKQVLFLSKDIGLAAGVDGTVSQNGMILKTTNGGTSWVRTFDQFTTGTGEGVKKIQLLNSTLGYLLHNNGADFSSPLYKTTDGGTSWTSLAPSFQSGGTFHFSDSNTGYLSAIPTTGAARLFKTQDGGLSWIPVPGTHPVLKALWFTSASVGYGAGANGALIKTIDAGLTWTALASATTQTLNALHFVDANNGHAAGSSGTMLKTTNGGATWASQVTGTGQTLNDVRFLDALTGYAAGNSGQLLKTSDGGSTWILEITGRTMNFNSLSFLPSPYPEKPRGFVCGAGGFPVLTYVSNAALNPPLAPTPTAPAMGASAPLSPLLAWTVPTGAASYALQLSSDSVFAAPLFNDSTLVESSRAIEPLAADTKYYWRVSARNYGGASPWSPTFSFTTSPPAPVTPVLLSPAQDSFGAPLLPTLSWAAVSGASAYRLQVATDSAFTAMEVNDSTLTTPSRAAGPLAHSTTYYWRVNARNASGTSAYSGIRRFTTLAPSSLRAVLIRQPTSRRNGLLRYTLKDRVRVRARVYDSKGALRGEPLNALQNPGTHTLVLPLNLSQGLYGLLDFQAGDLHQAIRLNP
jgi:photosystem II stability/assembly factor-like uncharacterized protein